MDDTRCYQFFQEPSDPLQRRYEAIRAVFVEGLSQKQAADRYDMTHGALRKQIHEFREACRNGSPPPFSLPRKTDRDKRCARRLYRNHGRATDRGSSRATDLPSEPLRLRTRVAGIFLFLPLLAKLQFDKFVQSADYPGTRMVPADAALLSLLALKLLDKERRSHIDDFNFDDGCTSIPSSCRTLIMNYARRNGVEDSLGTSVNFFHLDCLSSEVRLNVDLDVTMTVLACD